MRDECKSKLLVPWPRFQATTQRFMERDDFRLERTLQNLESNPLLSPGISCDGS